MAIKHLHKGKIIFLLIAIWFQQYSGQFLKPILKKFLNKLLGIGEDSPLCKGPVSNLIPREQLTQSPPQQPTQSLSPQQTRSPTKNFLKLISNPVLKPTRKSIPKIPSARPGCTVILPVLHLSPIITRISNKKLIYPKPFKNSFSIKNGEKIEIDCLNYKIITIDKKRVTVRCKKGKLHHDKERISNKLQCSNVPESVAVVTQQKCGKGIGDEIQIGYEIGKDQFIEMINVCFDNTLKTPLYSFHKLNRQSINRLTFDKQPFQESEFYKDHDNFTIRDFYGTTAQRDTINYILYLPFGSNAIINSRNQHVLEASALTPPKDFSYYPDVMSTYYYINTIPMWKTIKNTTWSYIEKKIRKYSKKHQVNLHIYTGIYGKADLPTKNTGKPADLYLMIDDLGYNVTIPIPELVWKVVYEPESKKGVTIICSNNPYLESTDSLIICKDVSNKIGWIKFNKEFTYGYTYACRIADFRKAVPYMPDIKVKDLLT